MESKPVCGNCKGTGEAFYPDTSGGRFDTCRDCHGSSHPASHPEPSVPFCPVHGLSIYADPPCCDGNAPPPESPLPVRDCKPCRGEGWLHYSTGAPMDVCEECHGTGCTSAYAAYNLIERLTNGK